MQANKKVHILGGGPAGLAAAYYLHRAGQRVELYEAGDECGGNAKTYEKNGFLYDSGAHRFHDKISDITQDIKNLLGDDLQLVSAPSQIYYNGRFLQFPLKPGNLLKGLGFTDFSKASFGVVKHKLFKTKPTGNFRDMVISTYGKNLSEKFLIPYSEKLWGLPSDQLSPDISGGRLKGLNLGAFFLDAIFKKQSKHLDGTFYYPKHGIGQISDHIVKQLGDQVHLNSKVTQIVLNKDGITELEINGNKVVSVDRVLSSLPLNLMIKLIHPVVSNDLLTCTEKLSYQNVLLVALVIDKPRVTNNATIYFPDRKFEFTRVVEPKNRSAMMSPSDKTMLVVEIPYPERRELTECMGKEIVDRVIEQLSSTGLISQKDVLSSEMRNLSKAYPVLSTDYQQPVLEMLSYLNEIKNLHTLGRNGLFAYSHIHDLFAQAKDISKKII